VASLKSVQNNYRLLGAIVEGPGGNVFIKFTGPAKTIAANQIAFKQLLNSFDKADSYVRLNSRFSDNGLRRAPPADFSVPNQSALVRATLPDSVS